ncbi:alpha/beta fold hydrolase [Allobranchiibius sp. GilTou73]|uniref:alpha/beta fold hydrolase n=1 Tax=Allobranchiibius sp. GilTou73 TaxID=2904523 RepID=UPI001F3BAD6E|nr:alpha/beta hydrolase [Allobranchiibius sp. GilTou73]UIJ34350.1 alpha/beta hydrolase [Allobranchiibius sp. GilTou73]
MTQSLSPAVPGAEHHTAAVAGTEIHYVTAGTSGEPILLVHGFPETWWAFHKLLPLLATEHRVIAVDLPGIGDSAPDDSDFGSALAARALHELIAQLGWGPVHLTGQDIAGNTVFRVAATYPDDVLSLTAIETGLSGFGWERFADVAHGGAWHVGALATPGIAEFVFTDRFREYAARLWYPHLTLVPDAVTDTDLDEFSRTYERPDGWRGIHGLYASALTEGDDIKALAESNSLRVPVLAVGAMSHPSTAETMRRAVSTDVTVVHLESVGHHPALEAPEALASALEAFIAGVGSSKSAPGST